MRDDDDEVGRWGRHLRAVIRLSPLYFRAVRWMTFQKNGITYDLSAADLDQIERIEREGLFVVS